MSANDQSADQAVNLSTLPEGQVESLAPPPNSQRKIIHCDCDCFYASVEMRDNPALRDVPLAIGGRPDQRGVVATCNYVAREYGIRSAMPMSQAVQRCPDLVIMRPAMEKYRIASRQIGAIYRDYTELVEPLSLDEAYLDVSNSTRCRSSATLIAQEIRARIAETVGITASAGVAPNKFLAKIASDWNKPNGQFVIRPHEVEEFVAVLPVKKLFGVGKVTAAKLNQLGVETCADLRSWTLPQLMNQFGKFGPRLYDLARGIDKREVCPSQERKSISVEETYAQDLRDLAACREQLPLLLRDLDARIGRAEALRNIRKLYVKIRFANFKQTTVECVGQATDALQYDHLLEMGFRRHGMAVRLLGLGVRLEEDGAQAQLALFDAAE